MTMISTDADLVTLINVFTVAQADQQKLVDLLGEATESYMRDRQGFVSANIHASLDGERVVNYAQWRSVDDFKAMLADPASQRHFGAANSLATAEPHLYRVASVHQE